jgi:hypothetical protein
MVLPPPIRSKARTGLQPASGHCFLLAGVSSVLRYKFEPSSAASQNVIPRAGRVK